MNSVKVVILAGQNLINNPINLFVHRPSRADTCRNPDVIISA
jgi:hypothetical protein